MRSEIKVVNKIMDNDHINCDDNALANPYLDTNIDTESLSRYSKWLNYKIGDDWLDCVEVNDQISAMRVLWRRWMLSDLNLGTIYIDSDFSHCNAIVEKMYDMADMVDIEY